jgi:hypothetical protein
LRWKQFDDRLAPEISSMDWTALRIQAPKSTEHPGRRHDCWK